MGVCICVNQEVSILRISLKHQKYASLLKAHQNMGEGTKEHQNELYSQQVDIYLEVIKGKTIVTEQENKSDNSTDPEFHSGKQQYNKYWQTCS